MADFSIALQEAWTPAPLHLRFSRAMLTEIRTLAEAMPLAHKGFDAGDEPAGRKQMA
ncbi:hypothetical protein [Rhizobium laguerreae]|uniref:hypothetical protein n=1 Tax=Rhizobium laguerreae TaxID=1076926 RepID=UPI001C92701A|nr:hypothetical protein [Rhizobium laguerreae]MBY3050877.1 hypothetical protein [Rhizobium laguerreae]MBY3213027.1 hypothetical protein [Rhizobium laguerreae]MBY3442143.1 hypothetical protein [Rhizobium laguerreae]